MIIDSSSLDLVSAIDSMLGEDPPTGMIQPELLESVLGIATSPCPDIPAAHAELVSLRGVVRDRARSRGLEIGAAGTHPFARWEDQRVVSDDRYQRSAPPADGLRGQPGSARANGRDRGEDCLSDTCKCRVTRFTDCDRSRRYGDLSAGLSSPMRQPSTRSRGRSSSSKKRRDLRTTRVVCLLSKPRLRRSWRSALLGSYDAPVGASHPYRCSRIRSQLSADQRSLVSKTSISASADRTARSRSGSPNSKASAASSSCCRSAACSLVGPW
jgi:Glutamate-cysteine ligase family 2(GCS2)